MGLRFKLSRFPRGVKRVFGRGPGRNWRRLYRGTIRNRQKQAFRSDPEGTTVGEDTRLRSFYHWY